MDENNVVEHDSGKGSKNASSTVQLIYWLYLVNVILMFTGLIGVIMAYINKSDAPEWLQSHYQLQIRTFWIGVLFGIVGMLTTVIFIGFLILLFTIIWYIVRCVKGLKYLGQNEAYPDPETWTW